MPDSAREKDVPPAFYLRYLQYLEKTGATLISQARRLEVLTDATVCSVAGGAAGLAFVFLFISQMNLGEFEKIGAYSSIPLFFSCVGLLGGRFLLGSGPRVRQDALRRVNQELSDGWVLIDKVTAELDALPKRKENSTRRLELERRLTVLQERDSVLAARLEQLGAAPWDRKVSIARNFMRADTALAQHISLDGEYKPPTREGTSEDGRRVVDQSISAADAGLGPNEVRKPLPDDRPVA
jgi:hypothetical protein